MTYQQILGSRIRNFRKRAKLSQLELELQIEASPGYLSRVENGDLNPTKETLQLIANTFNLNQREREYLHGSLFYPAIDSEIRNAIDEVEDYFNQRGVIAYLLDDRNRFIHISNSFLKVMGFTEETAKKNYLRSWTSVILDQSVGIKNSLAPEHYYDAIFNILERFYNDIYFMKDDKSYFETLESIKNDQTAQTIWNQLVQNPPKFRSNQHRTIHFKFRGINIPLTYSVESLMNNRRFEIVEYVPSLKLPRLLSNLI